MDVSKLFDSSSRQLEGVQLIGVEVNVVLDSFFGILGTGRGEGAKFRRSCVNVL